jgi:hypothetical protein
MNQLGPTKTAAQEDGENGTVSLAPKTFRRWRVHQSATLFGGEPVAETDAKLLHAFDPPYSGRNFGAQ